MGFFAFILHVYSYINLEMFSFIVYCSLITQYYYDIRDTRHILARLKAEQYDNRLGWAHSCETNCLCGNSAKLWLQCRT